MIDLFFWIGIFIVSLAVLIKSSDYFTDSSGDIGLFLGIPAFVVGVTIVAVGTSLPELISSIIAVVSDSSEIVAGNVVGSNIANIFLILGFAGIISIRKLKVTRNLIEVDLPVLVGSAFLLALMIYDGVFTFFEAIISLAGIVIYTLYLIYSREITDKQIKKELKKDKKRKQREFPKKSLIILLISIVFIYLGAKYTVESVIELSQLLNIGKEVIAITAVAFGTSLPELMVSISATKRGNPEMAVGNILGSNIFNTFAVMGTAGLFGILIIPQSLIFFGLPVMIVATLMYYFITIDKEITKWEGAILLLFYILFLAKTFNLF